MSVVADKVKKIIIDQLGVQEDQVTEDAKFVEDLGADSLDLVELIMAFEEEFGQDIPDEIQKRENLPAGVYVSQVEMDSPAMTAGIVPGDILYAVGENAFTGISALTEALFEASPGDTVLLKYYRAIGDSFEEMSVQVTLE